ncbi:MAG: DUF421 domain-containing protein [Bacilli bacterium]
MYLMTIFWRAIVSLFLLFFITKLIGKKQVSQLSLFDYVIGISIGNFAAEMTVNLEISYLNGVIAVLVFGFMAYLVSLMTMKSILLRRFFMGTPTILIQNGKIVEKNLRKVKFDINDLLEECRSNGYFDITEIEYGIMEANGKLSILVKSEYKPVTTRDMNVNLDKSDILANVIIDGHIMKKNLKNMGKTEEWIIKQIKVKGVRLRHILLCLLDCNEKITIYKKNEFIKVHDVLE